MDNKRQEISTCQKSLGEMERRVHQYRQEQVPAFTELGVCNDIPLFQVAILLHPLSLSLSLSFFLFLCNLVESPETSPGQTNLY